MLMHTLIKDYGCRTAIFKTTPSSILHQQTQQI